MKLKNKTLKGAKVKKIIAAILILSLAFLIIGCSKEKEIILVESNLREYTQLSKESVLVLSTGERLANNTTSVESNSYFSKVISRTYNVLRSTYQTGANGEIHYQSYWYRIEVLETRDQEFLGKKTETIDTSYAFLIYTENESLSIKKITETTVSFNYEGGWRSIEFERIINLNSYFDSEDTFLSAIPELFEKIQNTPDKYYVDVTVPITTFATYQQISNFYYFDTLLPTT